MQSQFYADVATLAGDVALHFAEFPAYLFQSLAQYHEAADLDFRWGEFGKYLRRHAGVHLSPFRGDRAGTQTLQDTVRPLC